MKKNEVSPDSIPLESEDDKHLRDGYGDDFGVADGVTEGLAGHNFL